MISYPPLSHAFRTPGGVPVTMHYRGDTSDWNTLYSALNEDEYQLGHRDFSGWAIDVGAHIGSVSVGLAVDNPGLEVIAIEAIPENADLVSRNAEQNGVDQRIRVHDWAAAEPGKFTTTVHFRYQGSESATHHAFIGNSELVRGAGAPELVQETAEVSCISLGRLLDMYQIDRVALLKIDCEGCEYGFLMDPAVERCDLIVGEWHPVGGKVQADIVPLLERTHSVTFTGPQAGPGGFVAVRRSRTAYAPDSGTEWPAL